MSSFTASSVERGVVSSENNLFEIAAAMWNVFYILIIGIHSESDNAVIYSFVSFTSFSAVKLIQRSC